ncbi:hypothetical protein B0A58_11405 [Flavobacterium branchiophilum NBRC 15030 = ATCC 35035]|uniref:Lipoprotein n=1 Tax=Flavobacterium branchiophilum TaxID=55197 RepID=A0A543FZN4_9FLAO|nr:hypothetical protein [Flavobacterium branchiophilum]OXA73982.1 hypothetical protein B0A58_11405 [Flavobacterium branchiophilum NBRC 15030 = ATCC 35035]TQM39293.1 hypothetical protein BC670_0071 [Flavobacterium branchiophilum]GEM54980.1 hypothetical protein FB1_12010 [Flavobacterium branchiophilum NBRC 15030 = ATCC 35035]
MKTKLLLFLFFILYGCISQKKSIGIYVLTKKNTSYNIVLKLEDNKRYELQTVSSVGGGITRGNWVEGKNNIKLLPDKPNIDRVFLDDTIVDRQEFRPFSDTIILKIKGNKLYRIKGAGIISKKFCLIKL